VLDRSWETNYRQKLEDENTLIQKKPTIRDKDEKKYTKNIVTKNMMIHDDGDDDDNSVHFFIIYVLSQQL
jgi:hypothetical protein